MAVVGMPTRRIEGLEKLTGSARFTEDLRLPGMLHARLLLSPYPHARIVRLTKEAALEVPGVVAVLTIEDLPIPPGATARRMLARKEVRYTGEPIAAVLAETGNGRGRWRGPTPSSVDYEVLPEALDALEAIQDDAPLVSAVREEDSEAAGHGANLRGCSQRAKT